MKTKKSNLIIWAVSALILGIIIGVVINSLNTTGQAKAIALNKSEQSSSGSAFKPDNDKTHQEFLAKYEKLLNQKIPDMQAPEIEKPELTELYPEPTFTNVTNINLEFPKNGNCVELDQAFFDQYNTDINFIAQNGCVELIENINFNHTIIINGQLIFYGNDYTLFSNRGTATNLPNIMLNNYAKVQNIIISSTATGWSGDGSGVILNDYSEVTNCTVSNKYISFLLNDNSTISNSSVINCVGGFSLRDNSIGNNLNYSHTDGGGVFGYRLYDMAIVNDSECHFAFNCFAQYLTSVSGQSGTTEVNNSLAECESADHSIGFALSGNQKNTGCEAKNCGFGFILQDTSQTEDAQSYNNNVGYRLSSVRIDRAYTAPDINAFKLINSSATNNNIGFDFYSTIPYYTIPQPLPFQISGLIAQKNTQGIIIRPEFNMLEGISQLTAIDNTSVGIYMNNTGTLSNVDVSGSPIGVKLDNGTVIDSTIYNNIIGVNLTGINPKLAESSIHTNEIGILLENQARSVNNIVTENSNKGIYVLGAFSGTPATIDSGRYCNNVQNMFIHWNGIVQGTIYTTPTTIPGMYTNNNATILDCSQWIQTHNHKV